ncbi:MAG: hypothetical protein Q7K57_47775 [Burkholderiaceae bacterium]|nr:hypothetical protein [Burkholderiaceae bacterium]
MYKDFSQALSHAQQLRTNALFAVHAANRAFVEKGWTDPVFVAAKAALNSVLIELAQAKWMLGRVDKTYLQFATPLENGMLGIEGAERGFRRVISACDHICKSCQAGIPPSIQIPFELTKQAEIQFAGTTPMVPTICPVVLLQGSNHDMGKQYAQQVIEIYGHWIFARQASRILSAKELKEVGRWEAELMKFTPDVLQFAAGMAEGSSQAGLKLSYEQSLAIWTGVRPPAREPRPMAFAQTEGDDDRIAAAYLGVSALNLASDADMCSGICAWGRATNDGSLIAGSTTDHDCTFMATIVAFPDEGIPFIYTPFSANGSIPVLGDFHMGGHPGMNASGLAYVHHGGANTGEPLEQWGYGVRRGPSTFHLLQFCTDAAKARRALRAFPVGDSGISLGTVGGLFADSNYGFSLESRPGAPDAVREIIREHSYDMNGRPCDFLYANNNALAPESGHLNCPPSDGYQYTVAGGWFTLDWDQINAEPGPKALRRLNTRSSEGRNRYAYKKMIEGYGRIDIEYMKMVYRQSGETPMGSFEEIQKRWQSGEPWNSSTAHRGNAFTAVMRPQRGEDGVYLGCVGPANAAVHSRGPEHGYHYFDETNVFSELRLRRDPEGVLDAALDQADGDRALARALLREVGRNHPAAVVFNGWLHEADAEFVKATQLRVDLISDSRAKRLAVLSRGLRAAIRTQVRSRQICEAVSSSHGSTI